MVHRKLGIIFFPRTRANFAAGRVKGHVDKLVGRIDGACKIIPDIEAKIKAERAFIEKSDSKVAFDKLSIAEQRLVILKKACETGREVKKVEPEKVSAEDLVRDKFEDVAKACRKAHVKSRTKPTPEDAAVWVDCMKKAGYEKVDKYLSANEREDFPL